jgi:sugar/nucleoside kinase (ribokinase family)
MPQSQRGPVVVVGDALIDEIHDEDGSSRDYVGGAALNVAMGLARLGIRTQLIAMIGDDEDGATIRSFLAEHDVELIPTIGPFGSSRGVSSRVNGEPVYVFNQAAQNRRVNVDAEQAAALRDAALVVVSCFPFDDVEQTEALIAAIPNSSQRLVIDPNPRESMMHDRARFVTTFEALAPKALLIKVGDDDAKLLYGSSLESLTRRLLAAGTQNVLATAGKDGASVTTSDGHTASEPIVSLPGPVIDTMGAGDATLASIVATFMQDGTPATDADWNEALTIAMRIAAATCRHEGALLQLP